jgi:hypothetical protein
MHKYIHYKVRFLLLMCKLLDIYIDVYTLTACNFLFVCLHSGIIFPSFVWAVIRISFGQAVLGDDNTGNKIFLTYLFVHRDVGIQFLKETGLIRTQMRCNTYGRVMT